MKTTFNALRQAYRQRAEARRIYNATKHLDRHLLNDIGVRHDPMRDRAYPL